MSVRKLALPTLALSLAAGALLPARLPAAGTASLQGGGLTISDVYLSKSEGYDTFRIPALSVTKAGMVLAFAEGRKQSSADDGDVDLVLRRSADAGKTWTPLQVVHEEGGNAPITIGNPCMVQDRDSGEILLTFCRDNERVFVSRSRDDGRTWSKPEEITAQVKPPGWTWYATGPGNGIQLERGPHRGRMVIPCDHRLKGDTIGSYSHVIYSDDRGKTWKLGGSADYGTNESQVVERGDGTLMLSMRRAETHEGSDRAVATSADGGLTWSKVTYDKALFMPRAQVGLVRFTPPGAKPVVLITSPNHPSARWKLTARLSDDDGRTWPAARVIHPLRAAYSCVGVLPDGTVLCLYEGGVDHYKEGIRLARFTVDWVRQGEPAAK